jgi:hypothetical protein
LKKSGGVISQKEYEAVFLDADGGGKLLKRCKIMPISISVPFIPGYNVATQALRTV